VYKNCQQQLKHLKRLPQVRRTHLLVFFVAGICPDQDLKNHQEVRCTLENGKNPHREKKIMSCACAYNLPFTPGSVGGFLPATGSLTIFENITCRPTGPLLFSIVVGGNAIPVGLTFAPVISIEGEHHVKTFELSTLSTTRPSANLILWLDNVHKISASVTIVGTLPPSQNLPAFSASLSFYDNRCCHKQGICC